MKKIIADGLKPTATNIKTQKQELRNAIEECSSHSKNFRNSNLCFLKNIRFPLLKKGEIRYLHPDRDKRITEKALGTQYGKEHLEQLFLRKNPITILYVLRSHLRLVVDLQKNVKAMQSPGYAHRVKIFQSSGNGKYHYREKHGYNTQTELKSAFSESQKQLDQATDQLMEMNAQLESVRRGWFTDNICTESNLYRIFKSEKQRQIPKGTHR